MSRTRNLRSARRSAHPFAAADLALAEWAEPWSDHPVVEAVGTVSELADQPPLIALSCAVALGGALRGDRRMARTGMGMLAAHLAATAVKTAVKNRVDRPRPGEVADEGGHEVDGRGDPDGDRSLPSGHTAGAVAVARAVARGYPHLARGAYAAAAAAALVQIPRQTHHASDVAVGTVIGLAAEAGVAALGRIADRASREPLALPPPGAAAPRRR